MKKDNKFLKLKTSIISQIEAANNVEELKQVLRVLGISTLLVDAFWKTIENEKNNRPK